MKRSLLICLPLFFSLAVLAQPRFRVGDPVEVVNIGKGIIVSGYQQTDFGYGTYQVHMDGERYCNNHVLDTRYAEQHIVARKAPQPEAPAPGGPARGPEPAVPPGAKAAAGAFRQGDTVLYTQTSVWGRGVVKGYDAGKRMYTLQDVYVSIPCHSIAPLKGPYATDFFTGTWDVRVSDALYSNEAGGKKQGNISGGMRLYRLTILPNGTYRWKVAANKTLTGRWIPRAGAPGIVILKGIDGRDWTVYETTEAFATTRTTKDEIRFHHQPTSSGYYVATRVGLNRSCLLAGRKW